MSKPWQNHDKGTNKIDLLFLELCCPIKRLRVVFYQSIFMEELFDENLEQASSSTLKRTRRPTSIAWNEFDLLNTCADGRKRAKCKNCGQLYVVGGAGTSNLLRHMLNCPSKESHDFLPLTEIDQEMYREKMATAIIKHNYPFMFAEHEGIRDLHSFLNPSVKSVSRNTAKADVLKVFEREKLQLKRALESKKCRGIIMHSRLAIQCGSC